MYLEEREARASPDWMRVPARSLDLVPGQQPVVPGRDRPERHRTLRTARHTRHASHRHTAPIATPSGEWTAVLAARVRVTRRLKSRGGRGR